MSFDARPLKVLGQEDPCVRFAIRAAGVYEDVIDTLRHQRSWVSACALEKMKDQNTLMDVLIFCGGNAEGVRTRQMASAEKTGLCSVHIGPIRLLGMGGFGKLRPCESRTAINPPRILCAVETERPLRVEKALRS